jgi:hypothetical protein
VDKKEIHRLSLDFVNARLEDLQKNLDDLNAALEEEGKSTAGDKHETGRAMVHQEMENLNGEIQDLQMKQNTLLHLEETDSSVIMQGSLVKAGGLYIYIAAAIGKIKTTNGEAMVISQASPLGHLLLGKKKANRFPLTERHLQLTLFTDLQFRRR